MSIKQQIHDLLSNLNTYPFLLVGAGISRRYIGLPDWKGLLTAFANEVKELDVYSYKIFENQARTENPAVDNDYDLYPYIGSLIESEYNKLWLEDSKFQNNRLKFREYVIDKDMSPFKVEVSDLLKHYNKILNPLLNKELEELRNLQKNVSGIITTNYDTLIEDVFEDFKVYIGQENLLLNELSGMAELYKIHGCISNPGSIVLNSSDYKKFNDKNAYLIAKLLTIFVEYPIVILGYSLSDRNIKQILNNISYCLNKEQIDKISNRIILVEWNNPENKEKDRIGDYILQFESAPSLNIKHVFTNDFLTVYKALNANKTKYTPKSLRRLKEHVYNLITAENASKKKLMIQGLDNLDTLSDSKLGDVEMIIGLAIFANYGKLGFSSFKPEDLYRDTVLENAEFRELPEFYYNIIKRTLAEHWKRNPRGLPLFIYLKDYLAKGYDLYEVNHRIRKSLEDYKTYEYKDFLNKSIRDLRKKQLGELTSQELLISLKTRTYKDKEILRLIQSIFNQVKFNNIDIKELKEILEIILTEYTPVIESSVYSTALRRLIRIYDWMKYSKDVFDLLENKETDLS